MIAVVFPLGTLLVLGLVVLVAHVEDVRAKARRIRKLRADDASVRDFDEWRKALG